MRPIPSVLRKVTIEDLCRFYLEGESLRSLESSFGSAQRTLRKILLNCGIRLRAGPQRISEARKAVLVARYLAGNSVERLAREFGHDRSYLYEVIRKSGVAIRRAGPYFKAFDQADSKRICNAFSAGTPMSTLAREQGVSLHCIKNLIRRAGLEPRNRMAAMALRRRPLNENAFDKASESESAAYFVGLLIADGCVYEDRHGHYQISLSLSGPDRFFVGRFKEFVGSGSKISDRRPPSAPHLNPEGRPIHAGPSWQLRIQSDRMAAVLATYGMTPRKSLTAELRGGLEHNRHAWRGVIDGDGSVLALEGRPQLLFCGSPRMAEQFVDFGRPVCPQAKWKVRMQGKIARVAVSGRHAQGIVRYLYADCSIALPRKLRAAQAVMGMPTPRRLRDWSWITPAYLTEQLEALGSWRKIAIQLGMDVTLLCKIRRRLGMPLDVPTWLKNAAGWGHRVGKPPQSLF